LTTGEGGGRAAFVDDFPGQTRFGVEHSFRVDARFVKDHKTQVRAAEIRAAGIARHRRERQRIAGVDRAAIRGNNHACDGTGIGSAGLAAARERKGGSDQQGQISAEGSTRKHCAPGAGMAQNLKQTPRHR